MGLSVTLWKQLDAVADWGLLATDLDLIVTGWNRWLEYRSGVKAEDAVGRPLFELFPDLPTRRVDRYYRQALSGQSVILSQRFHQYLLPFPTTIGGTGPARMQQSARILPLREGPDLRGTLTLIEDVTERVVHEAELLARARQQTALAGLARLALAGSSPADLAVEVARHLATTLAVDYAEVLEFRANGGAWSALAGTGWTESHAPRGARFQLCSDSEAVTTVQVASNSDLASDAYLRTHGVSSGLIVRIPGEDRQPFGVVGIYTRSPRHFTVDEVQFVQAVADILGVAVERIRLEEELRLRIGQLAEADRRKDEFLAMLAHELRNSLAPVRNALQVLQDKGSNDPLLNRMWELMARQIGHMTRLVDDLLDVSRITTGKVTLRKEPVNLATVVFRVIESTRSLIEAQGHQLLTALPPEPIHLDADPARLAQILGNLLNNAAKYTPEGGRIGLTVARQGTEAVISVRDTGVGISAEMLPRVFDLFTQVDASLDRSQGGLGIGLTLVRSLVELHGGSVSVMSAGPDLGSEFVVRLPITTDGSQSVEVETIHDWRSVTPRSVLIVDDNIDSVESLAELLQLAGHQVRTANDGLAALEVAEVFQPEFVLLDIGLPRLDGYEVARRLRSQPAFHLTILIALTGYGQDDHRRRGHEAGFNHYLVKPIDPALLKQLFAADPPK